MNYREAINHTDFAYCRVGSGCWRDTVWIYHTDSESPTNVRLVSWATIDEAYDVVSQSGGKILAPRW